MNAAVLLIIGIPAIEIYLMIKVGGVIGALNTILLIFFTAITGLYFAKMQGLSTIKSGLSQLIKNEIPVYEIISMISLGDRKLEKGTAVLCVGLPMPKYKKSASRYNIQMLSQEEGNKLELNYQVHQIK